MARAFALFPMFMKLAGRPCLVVGGGALGLARTESLLRCGAKVVVVAPEANPRMMSLARRGRLRWVRRRFTSTDVRDAFLVVAATDSAEINHSVFAACRKWEVPCNVVDDPQHCDFYYPAVVRRGLLQIAVSTGGTSPMLAHRLRQELEKRYGPEYAAWAHSLARARQRILAKSLPAGQQEFELRRVSSAAAFSKFKKKK